MFRVKKRTFVRYSPYSAKKESGSLEHRRDSLETTTKPSATKYSNLTSFYDALLTVYSFNKSRSRIFAHLQQSIEEMTQFECGLELLGRLMSIVPEVFEIRRVLVAGVVSVELTLKEEVSVEEFGKRLKGREEQVEVDGRIRELIEESQKKDTRRVSTAALSRGTATPPTVNKSSHPNLSLLERIRLKQEMKKKTPSTPTSTPPPQPPLDNKIKLIYYNAQRRGLYEQELIDKLRFDSVMSVEEVKRDIERSKVLKREESEFGVVYRILN